MVWAEPSGAGVSTEKQSLFSFHITRNCRTLWGEHEQADTGILRQ